MVRIRNEPMMMLNPKPNSNPNPKPNHTLGMKV